MAEAIQYRSATFERKAVDIKNRTVELSVSSEVPVERNGYVEVLDHAPGSVNLERFKDGGPLLLDHKTEEHVGTITKVNLGKDRILRCTVKLSRSVQGEEILQDLADGIRTKASLGYRLGKRISETIDADGNTIVRFEFTPLEASLVSVPADFSVGVGRSQNIKTKVQNMENENQNEFQPGAMESLVRRWNRPEVTALLEPALRSEMPLEHFKDLVRGVAQTRVSSYVPSSSGRFDDNGRAVRSDSLLGMGSKEIRGYSILKAMASLASNKPLSGLESEASIATARRLGREPKGFFIPSDVLAEHRDYGQSHSRALEAGTFTAAGAMVHTSNGGLPLIQLLRNQMVVAQMGATMLSGLTGDVDIPRQTGAATASWLSEAAEDSLTDQAVGQLALRPHRLAGATAFSKQLLAQSSVDIENFVRGDLMAVIAIAKDLACLRGTGVSGQPLGIVNTSNLSTAATHTTGGNFTWGQAIDYETQIETSNALNGTLGYVMRAVDKAKAKITAKDAGGASGFVWEDNMINGYKALSSNQLTTGAGGCMFGNWSDLLVADWDGLDVVVDPYSLSLKNQIRIVINQLCDTAVRNPKSFCISAA